MRDRPHICFVSDTIHCYFDSGEESGTGGAERQQYLLINELKHLGYPISVATLDYTNTIKQSIDGINIWYVIPRVRGVANAPYKAVRTIRGLRKIDADLYYVRGNDFLCMVTAFHAAISGSACVYAVANDANVDPELLDRLGIIKYPFIWAMRSAECVVAQTRAQEDLLANVHGIEAVRIPNGYEIPPDSEIIPHSKRTHVLWVGSMDPEQKRPERFLDLARQLQTLQFRMIGPRDNDKPDYYDQIEEESHDIPNLEFIGYVDPDAIYEHFRTAIALVNTSDYEGFPNTYLEAWRYKTPVVSLYHSFDDLLQSEGIGINAGSMDALIEWVQRLNDDVDLRNELGKTSREFMVENYSLERLVEEYDQLFQSLERS